MKNIILFFSLLMFLLSFQRELGQLDKTMKNEKTTIDEKKVLESSDDKKVESITSDAKEDNDVDAEVEEGEEEIYVEEGDTFSSEIITEDREITFDVIEKEDASVEKGVKEVSQGGVNGLERVTIKIEYKNGEEIGRSVINTEIISDAIDEIVVVGTMENEVVEDHWINITRLGNSGEYFESMDEASMWAEAITDNPDDERFCYSYTVIQTTWKNERTGELEERGFTVEFRP